MAPPNPPTNRTRAGYPEMVPTPERGTPAAEPLPPDPGQPTNELQRIWQKLGPLGPLAIAASTLPLIGLASLIYFRTPIAEWLRSLGSAGLGVYIGLFAAAAGLALSPTHVPSIIGGWVFGFPAGGWAAMAAVLAAALVGYAVARLTAGDRLVRAIEQQPKARAVFNELVNSSPSRRAGLVFLVRLASSPFALTNVVLAAARIPFPQYLLCTILGIMPRTLAAAWIGSLLQDLGAKHPSQRWLTIGTVVIAVVTVLLISNIAQRAVQRATAGTAST